MKDEKKIVVEFTTIQHKNVIAFLNRINLTGAEAPAYMEVMTALMSGKKE